MIVYYIHVSVIARTVALLWGGSRGFEFVYKEDQADPQYVIYKDVTLDGSHASLGMLSVLSLWVEQNPPPHNNNNSKNNNSGSSSSNNNSSNHNSSSNNNKHK